MIARRMRPFFFALLVSTIIPMTVCAQAQSSAAAHTASALASIELFQRTKAVPDLEAALKQLELASAGALRNGDREKILAGYVKLFGTIDSSTPRLNRGELPAVNVVPPKVKGVAYPAGVDPAAIADPTARARYQAALRANDALTDRYIAAMSLHRLDERALNLFSAFARNTYGKSSGDQREFQRQIEQTDLTAPRKSKLLSVGPNA
jgi:hypothetical protein